uniref:Uncharacterized protein n=1 Tax=Arundo donax TaxID=35708 RepID=A0A0A8ZLF5_ARUDO
MHYLDPIGSPGQLNMKFTVLLSGSVALIRGGHSALDQQAGR